ncbi:MAG: DUF1538 domain-containing protein [Treponema sp.]|nr:DUF1538 domain-containing protein [Spirochaetia bacterium]MDD7460503.1 DUF1538 domain-containing protein [Spirochaetales bacterium]MDY5812049.1 DUF1538 domain-containing protein [Treponema sp.]
MNILKKSKETLCSVAPIMALVLILAFTAVPFTPGLIARFLTGGLMVIAGLTLFLIGIDIGIIPIGERSGAALTSKKNLKLLLSVSFLIGFMITIAEPDVQVLAGQIGNLSANVNKWTLVIMIALGVGFFVTLGLCRTVLSLKLRRVLIISYLFLFALAYFCPDYLQGAAFDAGGATTGPMTVPFIMALGMGVASVRAGKNSRDNDSQFGLTGIASIGPIAAVCLYGIILNYFFAHDESLTATTIESAENLPEGMRIYATLFPEVFSDVFKSLFPLLIMFICFQIFLLKMPPVQLRKMFSGVVYCFIGLVLFLLGAEGGFMPAGQKVGEYLGFLSISKGGIWTFIIIILAFIFGAITVCAEPAVWVLTEQVEEASGGNIKRRIMLTSLSLGVAFSIGLSILKIIYGFSIWYILIPGYALALILTFFCPPLFTGIAFDSGGVASGPMTSTFILSFTLGCASSYSSSSSSAFGVIALVAMTPLIAIQILGIIYKIKTKEVAD